MKRFALALCLAALAAPALDAQDAAAPATSARRRVAVLDFDYATGLCVSAQPAAAGAAVCEAQDSAPPGPAACDTQRLG